jgi:hypothetical protein
MNKSAFTERVSLKSDQADADAEYMLEHILYRQNYAVDIRDSLAAYLKLVVKDAPRGGKMTARRARARGGAGRV